MMNVPETISSDYHSYLINDRETILQDASDTMSRLVDLVNSVTPRDDLGHINLVSIIEDVTTNNVLDNQRCQETSPDVINKLLKELLEISKSLDTKELLPFIDYLVRLSKHHGILLPFCGQLEDSPSFMNVESDFQINNEAVWKQLSASITDKAVGRLKELPTSSSIEFEEEFGGLVETLLIINKSDTAWKHYQDSRLHTLHSRITSLFYETSPGEEETLDLSELARRWFQFADEVTAMLNLDFRYIPQFNVASARETLLNFYLDAFSDEIRHFTSVLLSTLETKTFKPIKEPQSAQKQHPYSGPSIFRTSRKTAPLPAAEDERELDDLFQESGNSHVFIFEENVFLAVCDTIGALCRIENRLFSMINSYWTCPVDVDLDHTPSTTKKPKGVLKKTRRGSRQNSPDIILELGLVDSPSFVSGASPMIEEGTAVNLPYLEWQSELEAYLNSFAKSLEVHMYKYFRQVNMATAPFPCSLIPHAQEVPIKVSESLAKYVAFIDRIVPTILGCCEEMTESVFTVFNNTITVHLDSFVETLRTNLSCTNIDLLALSISDLQFIQLSSFHWGTLFMPKNAKLGVYFYDRRKQYSDLSSALARQIVIVVFNRLTTSIMQDAESNNWSDNKEFYEGERIGFPIQGWMVHMQKVWHCISSCCTPSLSKSVFTDLLIESFEFLVQRYAGITPSFRRVKQMRGDMLAMLHFVEQFLYKICDSAETLLGFGEELSSVRRIHYLCISLLQIMATVTAPLETINKIHGEGFYRSREPSRHQKYTCTYWLMTIKPHIYSSLKDANSACEFDASSSLYVLVQLFKESTQFTIEKTVELLTANSIKLSCLLVSHLNIVDPLGQKGSEPLFTAFFRTFSVLIENREGLASLIMPICEKSKFWTYFDGNDLMCLENTPAWIKSFFDVMEPYIIGISNALYRMMLSKKRKHLDLDSKLFPSGVLPCGCPIKTNVRPLASGEEYALLSEVAGQVFLQVLMLPPPLQLALSRMHNAMCGQSGTAGDSSTTAPNEIGELHLALVMTLASVRSSLDKQFIRGHCPAESSRQFANSTMSKLVQIIKDADELASQRKMVLTNLRKLEEENMNEFSEIHQGGTYGKKFLLEVQVNRILGTIKGSADLKLISHFIGRNIPWINYSLQFCDDNKDCQPGFHLSSLPDNPSATSSPPSAASSTTDSYPPASDKFDIISATTRLGGCKLDQEKFMEPDYLNWDDICCAELGISDVTFRSLLAHRWEMQVDAHLDSNEKCMVDRLFNRFLADPRKEVTA